MKLFHRIFLLLLLLGISPILVISIWFALPFHLQFHEYRWVVGIMLVIATVLTLCLCGIVIRILQKSQEKERIYVEQRSLTKLAAQVSHDIRSPLSSLQTVSECLSRLTVDHPDWSQYMELLELSTRRLLCIADDLLEKHQAQREMPAAFLLQQKSDENHPAVHTLRVGADRTVVVVDDDPSMRKRWEIILQEKQCRVVTFDSYEALTRSPPLPVVTAIVDFQFLNSQKNGFDVLAWLQKKGASHLYLCTSDYWKSAIQKRASELGVPVLPKPPPEIQVTSL